VSVSGGAAANVIAPRAYQRHRSSPWRKQAGIGRKLLGRAGCARGDVQQRSGWSARDRPPGHLRACEPERRQAGSDMSRTRVFGYSRPFAIRCLIARGVRPTSSSCRLATTPCWRLASVHGCVVWAPTGDQRTQPSSIKRRGRDSNPRDASRRPTVFKTAAFVRSATPPGRKSASLQEIMDARPGN
jgi:hypothetical protein